MKRIIICCLVLLTIALVGCNNNSDTSLIDTTPAVIETPDTTTAPVADTTPAETTPAETTPAETTPAPVETTPAPVETTTPAPAETTTPAPAETKPTVSIPSMEFLIGSIDSTNGADIVHNGRFKVSGMFNLAEIKSVEVTDGYCLTWFAYDKDQNYIGNGSNKYPSLPTAEIWMSPGADIAASDITAWNANAAYLRLVVKRVDDGNISLDTDIVMSELTISIN